MTIAFGLFWICIHVYIPIWGITFSAVSVQTFEIIDPKMIFDAYDERIQTSQPPTNEG